MELEKEKVVFFKQYSLDEVGTIFLYDNKYYRMIKNSKRTYVKKLLMSGLIDELIEKGLFVNCVPSDYTIDGNMVLEQETIDPAGQDPYNQWSFLMMRAAALSVLEINALCNKYGYQLMDCHQDNVRFRGIDPIYIDFGSISKWDGKSRWRGLREFLDVYYYPLLLWSSGYRNLASAILQTDLRVDPTIIETIVSGTLGDEALLKEKSIERIKRYILDMKNEENAYWTAYQDVQWDAKPDKRFEKEIEWIRSKGIKSMVELGANQGYFSYNVASTTNVDKIVATDYDYGAIDKMFERLSQKKCGKVLPLRVDFSRAGTNELKCLQCELVVANALLHHLLLTNKMTMESIVKRLDLMTSKYLIVEFMPRGLLGGTRIPLWYREDVFLEALKKLFVIEKKETVEYGRTQIYAKKREHYV